MSTVDKFHLFSGHQKPHCDLCILSPLMIDYFYRDSLVMPSLQREKGHFEGHQAALAGLIGGAASACLLHPLELVKTRQAVTSSTFRAALTHGQGLKLSGLYKGVGANTALSASSWAIYFMSYKSIRNAIDGRSDSKTLTLTSAAVGAGIITTAVTNPLSVVRTRMILDNNGNKSHYGSLASSVRHIWRAQGFGGFYKGLIPSLLGVSHGAIQLLIYETIKDEYFSHPDTPQTLMATVVSKMIASFVTYPCQNARARSQAQPEFKGGSTPSLIQQRQENSKEIMATMKKLMKLRRFYAGFATNLVHVCPNVCIVFFCYEIIAGAENRV